MSETCEINSKLAAKCCTIKRWQSLLQKTACMRCQLVDGTVHITQLLPEILAMIFCHLDVADRGRVAQVCIVFRDAVYHPSVWMGVTAKLNQPNSTIFPSLVKRGIRRVTMYDTTGLQNVAQGIPNLESLDLNGYYVRVTDPTLQGALQQEMPHLTELSLKNCIRITDAGVRLIAQNLTRLVSLNLSECVTLTDQSLYYIAGSVVTLKRLVLEGCVGITDDGVGQISGWNRGSPDGNLWLEYLVLSGCINLTDQSLLYLSLGQQSLESLELANCVLFTDAGLGYVAKLIRLRELTLKGCIRVGDAGFEYLAKMVNLRRLDLTGCLVGDVGLAHLADGGSRLAALDLTLCKGVSDDGLRHLAKMADLRELSVDGCPSITGAGLVHLAEGRAEITGLNVRRCFLLGSGVGLLLISQCLFHLRLLKLSQDHFSDEGLKMAARNLRQLHTLDVFGRNRIGDVHKMRTRSP